MEIVEGGNIQFVGDSAILIDVVQAALRSYEEYVSAVLNEHFSYTLKTYCRICEFFTELSTTEHLVISSIMKMIKWLLRISIYLLSGDFLVFHLVLRIVSEFIYIEKRTVSFIYCTNSTQKILRGVNQQFFLFPFNTHILFVSIQI